MTCQSTPLQDDRAGRCDAAQNLTGLNVVDAIERAGLGVGLLKIDCRVFAHVKGIPINDGTLAGLIDVERAA